MEGKKDRVEQVVITAYVSDLLLEEALRRGVSRSAVVRSALHHWLGVQSDQPDRQDKPGKNYGRK